MTWLQTINQAITYIEKNLLGDITVEDVANHVYTSNSHFQKIFNLVVGITIGEYIRNRRLSLAGRELLNPNTKVIDVALKYRYDTPESFTKAFTRFHGIRPSEAKELKNQLKFYYPLSISVVIKGGFDMSSRFVDEFYWNDVKEQKDEKKSDKERYQQVVDWAVKAREHNPSVFDSLNEWILNDEEWTEEKLAENEQIFHGILGRFKEQNAQIREYLKRLDSSGLVNPAVYPALDRFDEELAGETAGVAIKNAVAAIFADFSVMKDRKIREQIAGSKTGPAGVESIELFGYLNCLEDCDACVQWALFMPDVAKNQQNGFRIKSFEYKKMPKIRFIGVEGEEYEDMEKRVEKMKVLDSMSEYQSGFDYDLLFMHFYGKCIDVGQWHGIFGRFMKADTPVPEGFLFFDLVPENNFVEGLPYLSIFAYAQFEGDLAAMHSREGYDSDAMYDVTRNVILSQNVSIPYPIKYWTAEVFLDGCDKPSTGYLFSTEE